MITRLSRQWHRQLTKPFGTSAGMGLPAADLADLYTHLRIANRERFAPWGKPLRRLHASTARLYRRIVVTGNFKSP